MASLKETDHQAWLRWRVNDIKIAKKISLRTLAGLIGMKHHVELQRYLTGIYPIPLSLVEKIADAFKITVDRFLQTDVQKSTEELQVLLDRGKNPKRALELALHLVAVACGLEEKIDAMLKSGKAHYNLEDFENAHAVWVDSYQLSQKITNHELRFMALNSYAHSLLANKMVDQLVDVLYGIDVEKWDNHEHTGRVLHLRGIVESKKGNYEQAHNCYKLSHFHYSEIGNRILIGRIEINLAHQTYHREEFARSKRHLLSAKENLENDTDVMCSIVDMNLARTYIMMGEIANARKIIDNRLQIFHASSEDQYDTLGKLLLMKADIDNDPDSAERIFELRISCRELKCNAADLLTEMCIKSGDKDRALKYYRLTKEFLSDDYVDYKKGRWV